ncbi:QueT transporter family protein [Abyssisolibacter fermentans]|uniref:QueT transporter family protein n=1 Tax=Abyssisolibacter fermentans TaxID=1766203 RepID=UPI00082C73B8|nr:QueT transporter family protein [Abyssisolibacter fermentans]
MKEKVKFLVISAMIAAMYTSLTLILQPISYGFMQIRVSEVLTVMPFFTLAAIPGLTIGCLISNIVGGNGILDIIFGTLATFIAALLSSKMKKIYLVPLPPVLINAVIIGIMISYLLNINVGLTMVWIGLGQLIACYGLGYPFMKMLTKYKFINKLDV